MDILGHAAFGPQMLPLKETVPELRRSIGHFKRWSSACCLFWLSLSCVFSLTGGHLCQTDLIGCSLERHTSYTLYSYTSYTVLPIHMACQVRKQVLGISLLCKYSKTVSSEGWFWSRKLPSGRDGQNWGKESKRPNREKSLKKICTILHVTLNWGTISPFSTTLTWTQQHLSVLRTDLWLSLSGAAKGQT